MVKRDQHVELKWESELLSSEAVFSKQIAVRTKRMMKQKCV